MDCLCVAKRAKLDFEAPAEPSASPAIHLLDLPLEILSEILVGASQLLQDNRPAFRALRAVSPALRELVESVDKRCEPRNNWLSTCTVSAERVLANYSTSDAHKYEWASRLMRDVGRLRVTSYLSQAALNFMKACVFDSDDCKCESLEILEKDVYHYRFVSEISACLTNVTLRELYLDSNWKHYNEVDALIAKFSATLEVITLIIDHVPLKSDISTNSCSCKYYDLPRLRVLEVDTRKQFLHIKKVRAGAELRLKTAWPPFRDWDVLFQFSKIWHEVWVCYDEFRMMAPSPFKVEVGKCDLTLRLENSWGLLDRFGQSFAPRRLEFSSHALAALSKNLMYGLKEFRNFQNYTEIMLALPDAGELNIFAFSTDSFWRFAIQVASVTLEVSNNVDSSTLEVWIDGAQRVFGRRTFVAIDRAAHEHTPFCVTFTKDNTLNAAERKQVEHALLEL